MRPQASIDQLTVLAFVGIIVCGGANAVAIRLGNLELTPFWGATLRFGLAAFVLLVLVAARRSPLPRGRARLGVLLYGLTAFAGAYAALYWGLLEAPAPTAMVVIATVPLMTLLIAVSIGQEQLTGRGLAGALIALVGVAIIVGDQVGAAVPVPSLIALFLGAGFIAVSGVIVKQIPPGDPVAANAVGMAVGAIVLAALAVVAAEPIVLPTEARTWATILYLAGVGSVALFMLVLYVLARWSASSTSYATLVMPIVTVVVAAIVLGETVGPAFVAGAALAVVGVYVGVSAGRPASIPRREPAASAASAASAAAAASAPGSTPVATRIAQGAAAATPGPAPGASPVIGSAWDCRPPGC